MLAMLSEVLFGGEMDELLSGPTGLRPRGSRGRGSMDQSIEMRNVTSTFVVLLTLFSIVLFSL